VKIEKRDKAKTVEVQYATQNRAIAILSILLCDNFQLRRIAAFVSGFMDVGGQPE